MTRAAIVPPPDAVAAPSPGAYTHAQVADLFQVARETIYRMPHVMDTRLPGRPVRYSRKKVDAILNGEATPRLKRAS